MTSIWIQKEFI